MGGQPLDKQHSLLIVRTHSAEAFRPASRFAKVLSHAAGGGLEFACTLMNKCTCVLWLT